MISLLNPKDIFNLLHLDKYFSNSMHRNIIKMQIMMVEFWGWAWDSEVRVAPWWWECYLPTDHIPAVTSAGVPLLLGTFVFLARSAPTFNFNF